MTWEDLEKFIWNITPKDKLKPVLVLHPSNEDILFISEAKLATSGCYGVHGNIIPDSHFRQCSPEEKLLIREDSYVRIEVNDPILICE